VEAHRRLLREEAEGLTRVDAFWTRHRAPDEPVKVVLGAMNFGRRTPEADAARVIDRAVERGVTLIDTANVYEGGESERIVGAALARHKGADVGVATKVGLGRVAGRAEGLAPDRVRAAVDESLARLGVDAVDLYYLHAPDPATPIAETLEAMRALLAEGKVRAFGVSNYASWQILEMTYAGLRPSTSQVIYNALIRQLDLEYRGFTRAHKIHTTIYNPLAGGLLTGRHTRSGDTLKGSRFEKNAMYVGRYLSDRFFELVDRYKLLAAEHGMSLVELAYGFCAAADFVDSVIVGPGSVQHLDEALDALAKPLAPALLKEIDAVSRAFAGTDARYAR
jgi:aryl-alcohol dehydrogenase-like predicted oxidoreductase